MRSTDVSVATMFVNHKHVERLHVPLSDALIFDSAEKKREVGHKEGLLW